MVQKNQNVSELQVKLRQGCILIMTSFFCCDLGCTVLMGKGFKLKLLLTHGCRSVLIGDTFWDPLLKCFRFCCVAAMGNGNMKN